MKTAKVLQAVVEAEDMCRAVVHYSIRNAKLLPEEWSDRKCDRMDLLLRKLYAAQDSAKNNKQVHDHAGGVLREAASTLAKMKALAAAKKQQIEYRYFA